MAVPLAARRKYMLAASAVATSNPREAAILGGILHSAIEHGRLVIPDVRLHMSHALTGWNLVNVDRRAPGNAEIAMVLARFEEALGHRFTA